MNATALALSRVKMTMRVYRVNPAGTVIEDRGTVTVPYGRGPVPLMPPPAPCKCPRCRAGQAVTL